MNSSSFFDNNATIGSHVQNNFLGEFDDHNNVMFMPEIESNQKNDRNHNYNQPQKEVWLPKN